MRRVVITGIAPIVYGAADKDEFWDLLLNKNIYLQETPPEFKCKSRYYVPKPNIESMGTFIEESSKIAVKCARIAKNDRGLSDFKEFGVILGIGIGSLGTAFNSYAAHVGGVSETNRFNRFNRMVIPMTMPNAAASHIAIDMGIEGFVYTVNTACSSGNTAIGEAYISIKTGRTDGVITGGVECLDDGTGGIMRAFDGLTTLTKSADGLPRPFSNSRDGFLFNMGAGCIIILEELERAKKRGAEIYAEITGYAHNNDAFNLMQMEPSGRKIEDLFSSVNINISEVDYINAHGTGTVQNDALEADVIKRVFGAKKPFLNSTKGIIGHSIGASAALETAVCALSIKKNIIHGNLVDCDVIEGLNLPVDAVETQVNCAVNCSYGFGGHNTLLVLKRYSG